MCSSGASKSSPRITSTMDASLTRKWLPTAKRCFKKSPTWTIQPFEAKSSRMKKLDWSTKKARGGLSGHSRITYVTIIRSSVRGLEASFMGNESNSG